MPPAALLADSVRTSGEGGHSTSGSITFCTGRAPPTPFDKTETEGRRAGKKMIHARNEQKI